MTVSNINAIINKDIHKVWDIVLQSKNTVSGEAI